MSIGSIKGFESNITKLSGFADVVYRQNSKAFANASKVKPVTVYSCKPLNVECDFCKEKIGLLKNDVFERSSKNLDKE